MKLKRSMYNIGFGLGSQIIILILGFIIPRMFLKEYGSDVNGLFSSISQIFTYVALMEAGIGAATVQALYKPVTKNDREEMSGILSATNKYYKKVSFNYIACVTLLSLFYPALVKSDISNAVIGIIIFIHGLAGAINFYFLGTITQLLIAEGKNYIKSGINLCIFILISIAKIILILNSADIVYIQISFFIISILQVLVYLIYFKHNYGWIDFDAKADYEALKQKTSFLIHQVSLLIFSSTDVIVLSVFCGLKTASVYAIYYLVINAVNTIIGVVHNSVVFVLGHTYHEDMKKYMKLHDTYDNYYIAFTFAMISVCYILFSPFIGLYTSGIDDIKYLDEYLPVLFCLIQLLTGTRMVSNNLIRIAGHMKKTVPRTIIESAINLSASLILVNHIGIYGVLIGTILALVYRTNDIIIYSNKRILKRSPIKTYKTIVVNSALFCIIVYHTNRTTLDITSYTEFIKWGFLYTFCILPAYFIINSIASPQSLKYLYDTLKPHFKGFRRT